jgi:hypothetical protein
LREAWLPTPMPVSSGPFGWTALDGERTYRSRALKPLIEFASAVDAVECAVQLQEAMDTANARLPEDRRIVLRIGINLGDIMVEGSDLYGDGVTIAARLETLAEPGSIVMSRKVHEEIERKLALTCDDLGDQLLKNMEAPIRVYRVAGKREHVPIPVDLPLPGKPLIAVLPFTTMSNDPEQEALADGLTEDLITDLSRSAGLFVIARADGRGAPRGGTLLGEQSALYDQSLGRFATVP